MSTFLQLCKKVASESGTISGDLPVSVANQTGRLLKIVNWTSEAWVDVQKMENGWKWMRKPFSGGVTQGTNRYAGNSFNLTDFGRWDEDNVKRKRMPMSCYLTATGVSDQQKLRQISFQQWSDRYEFGAQSGGRSGVWAISDQNELCYVPDDAYTFKGFYWRSPQVMTANGEIPEAPEHHHDIIVKLGKMKLAEHDEAWDAYKASEREFILKLDYLSREQLEQPDFKNGPLA